MTAWTFLIFNSAADLVMILRVYAMWSQSKWILCFLLFLYVPQVIGFIVFLGIYNNPNTHLSVTTFQVLDTSVCKASFSNVPSQVQAYAIISRLPLSVTLLILALLPTLKPLIEMYKATKQWQLNKYSKQLVRDGILYFLVFTLYNIIVACINDGPTISTTPLLFLFLFCDTIICSIMPRFIISIRELYDRSLHAHRQDIDIGFGAFSQTITGGNTVISAIAFADVATEQEKSQVVDGDSVTIRVEELERGSTDQVVGGDEDNSEAIPLEILRGDSRTRGFA
ncbi:hypothetical protein HD554DRAFT_2137443 [Boletus coccyginus]|nr:hypothetical protein HD554DRAFT_2137443 [Boletus coccyginus]